MYEKYYMLTIKKIRIKFKVLVYIALLTFYLFSDGSYFLAQVFDENSIESKNLQQTNLIFCTKKKPRCQNGKKAFCSNMSFRPKCLPGKVPDCCKEISRIGIERNLKCKPELLKCPI